MTALEAMKLSMNHWRRMSKYGEDGLDVKWIVLSDEERTKLHMYFDCYLCFYTKHSDPEINKPCINCPMRGHWDGNAINCEDENSVYEKWLSYASEENAHKVYLVIRRRYEQMKKEVK